MFHVMVKLSFRAKTSDTITNLLSKFLMGTVPYLKNFLRAIAKEYTRRRTKAYFSMLIYYIHTDRAGHRHGKTERQPTPDNQEPANQRQRHPTATLSSIMRRLTDGKLELDNVKPTRPFLSTYRQPMPTTSTDKILVEFG
jgi:hypothetical protein